MPDMTYEVKEIIATLDSDAKNPKQLRLESWNGAAAKYDLRSWWEDKNGNERMSKGITMDKEELYSLYEVLQKIFED